MSILQVIGQNIARHAQAYGVGGELIVLSFVAHWPETIPRTAQDWWNWVRSTFQTALPINRVTTTISTQSKEQQ